jgi:DNA-binding CsgD family transcriptional regulator/tetratricopeptide (TPR) repeat protein
MLIIATYRDDELDRLHPLQLVLGDLRSRRRALRLKLEPLSLAAVTQLANEAGVAAAPLYATTAGNPFFVTEALAAEAGTMPATIRDAVLGRAARLSAGARGVLDAVAVAPPLAELWLLEALVGEAISCLDECISAGMLSSVPGGIAFRHEFARRAVEESLPAFHRRALHRQALATLAAPPAGAPDLTRLAHHADAADDDAAVLRYAPDAAQHAASLGAHREAAAQYERALRFAGGATPDVRAGLLDRLSAEYYLTDQIVDAIAALERAIECRREVGDKRGESLAFCALSHRCWCTGRKAEARANAQEALELLAGFPPGLELAATYSNFSQLAMNDEDSAGSMDWGRRALELGEALGNDEIAVQALVNMGTTQLLTGGGIDLLLHSVKRAEAAGLDESLGRAYINIGWGITRTRSYGLAHLLDEGLARCEERGLETWRQYVLAYRARFDLDEGRWTEAADGAAAILRSPRSSLLLRVLALTITGLVRIRRGDPESREPLEEAAAIVQGHDDDLQWIAPVAMARAEAAWLDGLGSDVVSDATQPALDLATRMHVPWVIGELALLRRLASVDEPAPDDAAEPFALQLNGDWSAAAARWTELGCPYEAALALGDADDEHALRRALQELQRLGARPAATVIARRLRERGATNLPRGPRAATKSNAANLTPRELGVLVLVAEGLPNTQIAERLFLSTKTVDKHVSAVIRKLGTHSRTQACAEATRLGIT